MKIKILKSAKNDLREGFYFYESQQAGLGTYFLETLSSDIESLKLFAGRYLKIRFQLSRKVAEKVEKKG